MRREVVGTNGTLVTAWTVDAFSLFTRGLAAVGPLPEAPRGTAHLVPLRPKPGSPM